MLLDKHTTLAVIGAGAMGTGIAQIAALAGHGVIVVDSNSASLERGKSAVEAGLATLVRKAVITETDRASIAQHIRWTGDLAETRICGLAIEAIAENLDAKRAIFASLAELMPPGAVLASNTSSLSIAAIAKAVPDPQRVLGLHFFNPVPRMKLVEVVAGPDTAAATLAEATQLMQAWGKHPVRARDVPGFIVNLVARPYYAEGFAAWGEGIAPQAIDLALTACGGFRMGPLALADMIGQDINYTVATSVYAGYAGLTRFRPQPAQQALVGAGRLGRKTGKGVYDYGFDLPAPALAPRENPPRQVRGASHGIVARLVQAAGFSTDFAATANDHAPGSAVVDGVRLVSCDGRPLAAREDVDVMIDAVRDFDLATTVVLTARDPQAAAPIIALIQAAGREALLIPDRPGMIVTRTLAQLANAAADAAVKAVAEPASIDQAMIHGANHPQGPLAWAAGEGFAKVATILRHIADATGDTIYQPSVLLTTGA